MAPNMISLYYIFRNCQAEKNAAKAGAERANLAAESCQQKSDDEEIILLEHVMQGTGFRCPEEFTALKPPWLFRNLPVLSREPRRNFPV